MSNEQHTPHGWKRATGDDAANGWKWDFEWMTELSRAVYEREKFSPGMDDIDALLTVLAESTVPAPVPEAAQAKIPVEVQGMADCMHMVHQDLIEMGIIDKSVAPMFIPEAIARHIKSITEPAAPSVQAVSSDEEATHDAAIALMRRLEVATSGKEGAGDDLRDTLWSTINYAVQNGHDTIDQMADAVMAVLRSMPVVDAALAATQASPAVAPSKQDAIRQALAELASLSPEQLQAELASHKGKLRLEAPTAAALSHQAAAAGDAARGWRSLVERAVEVLKRHVLPDGISDHDALNKLYGIFDGPKYRAVADVAQNQCDDRQRQAQSEAKTVTVAMAAPKKGAQNNG